MSNDHLESQRRRVEEARAAGSALDPDISESWRRSESFIDPHSGAVPVDAEPDEVRQRWQASPIRRSGIDLEAQLSSAAADSGMVAAVTDENGRILWVAGNTSMLHRAEQVGFVPGGRWDEASAGTNALGLALVTGRLSTVFSAEHWVDAVRDWACWSVPITAPDGRRLGVIDLSCRWEDASPMAPLALGALGRLVESNLPSDVTHRHGDLGVAVGGSAGVSGAAHPPMLQIELLGTPRVRLGARELQLSPRQVELLGALAIVGPCSLDELQTHVWGERPVSATTVKAEISHLRRLLGGAIASRPYRLTVPTQVDVVELNSALQRGDIGSAVAVYRGQLIPRSDAPYVADHRHVIDVALRGSLLRSGDAQQLLRFGAVHRYDEEILHTALHRSPAHGPEHDQATAMLDNAQRW